MFSFPTTVARFSKAEDHERWRCLVCPNHCLISEKKTGICGVRRVDNGQLQVPWGFICGLSNDPIEKKPLYHVKPGSQILSYGMPGCTFSCGFCQNWNLSQVGQDEHAGKPNWEKCDPENLISLALKNRAIGIAATYNEPAVALEWMLDNFIAARKQKLLTCMITNGFLSKEAKEATAPLLDAANIDLKCFTENGYKELGGHLLPVLETIRDWHSAGVWLELTTLLVPEFNDSPGEIRAIAEFIAGISPDIPWHVSAYYPTYKYSGRNNATSTSAVLAAIQEGKEAGLHFVYPGNIRAKNGYEDTFCSHCGTLLINRSGYQLIENRLESNKCPNCEKKAPGIW